MSYEKKAMTAFAQAALAASDLITTKFANTKFTGPTTRVVRVDAPQVESTGGGKKARESIVLRPETGDPSAAITAGFLDVGVRACELRSYAALNAAHRARFQNALDLHQSEYDKFLGELTSLLEAEGFVVKVVEPEERQAKAQAVEATEKQSNTGVMIAVGVVAALLVVGLIGVFLVK
jgi:hypothetical protein